MIILQLIEIWHTQKRTEKNGKDNYMKIVQVKRLLVILKVRTLNVNDL